MSCALVLLVGAGLPTGIVAQSPGNGVSKSTYACDDPVAGKAFLMKYFPLGCVPVHAWPRLSARALWCGEHGKRSAANGRAPAWFTPEGLLLSQMLSPLAYCSSVARQRCNRCVCRQLCFVLRPGSPGTSARTTSAFARTVTGRSSRAASSRCPRRPAPRATSLQVRPAAKVAQQRCSRTTW